MSSALMSLLCEICRVPRSGRQAATEINIAIIYLKPINFYWLFTIIIKKIESTKVFYLSDEVIADVADHSLQQTFLPFRYLQRR